MKYFNLFKGFWKDTLEFIPRNWPKPIFELPQHQLSETQVYPIGININKSMSLATKKTFSAFEMGSDSCISSIGTCFAEELATFMKQAVNKGIGKYIYTEENLFNSSANWGRVYTIQNFLQIVKYSVTDSIPIFVEENDLGFMDPLREFSVGYFKTKAEAENGIKLHRVASREVFERSDIIVLTLGQNEGWLDTSTEMVLGSAPRKSSREKHPERYIVKEFDFIENLNDLEIAIKFLKDFNEKLQFIITVSPVASHATFLSQDVVTQSFAGKCLLRSVVHQIQKKMGSYLFYFPSFEMVLCDNSESFRADNRHVKRGKVIQIFDLLEKILKK
jgi:hypothetical protein